MGVVRLYRLIERPLSGAAFAQHLLDIALQRHLAKQRTLDHLASLTLEHAQYMQTMRWSLSPARD